MFTRQQRQCRNTGWVPVSRHCSLNRAFKGADMLLQCSDGIYCSAPGWYCCPGGIGSCKNGEVCCTDTKSVTLINAYALPSLSECRTVTALPQLAYAATKGAPVGLAKSAVRFTRTLCALAHPPAPSVATTAGALLDQAAVKEHRIALSQGIFAAPTDFRVRTKHCAATMMIRHIVRKSVCLLSFSRIWKGGLRRYCPSC